jgi:M6 family metalloprotease-like protein
VRKEVLVSKALVVLSVFSDKASACLVRSPLILIVFLVFLALVGIAPVGAFECACPLPAGKKLQASGHLSAMVIFAQFAGQGAGTSAPSWSADLFNPSVPGSFSHFYNAMSGGRLGVEGGVLPKRYSSANGAAAYSAEQAGQLGKFGQFNLEILRQADADTDFGAFDNDGPDGQPNSGDDDGYVDIVFVNLHTVPRDFFIATATGLASLGLDSDYISDDAAAAGGHVRVRSRFNGFGGTTQRGHTFSITASTMCHEFGHVLGLTDLFDQSSVTATGELDPEEDSAGIGKWGLMGLGTLGWGVEDGPNAFSGPSLAQLGWVEVETLDAATTNVAIDEVFVGRRVVKIPLSRDEYFLLEHRRKTGSYYNRNVPQDGLLIWHIDERADNDEERHKQVDLVCADGLFADRGFPGVSADVVAGRDNLDFWSRDAAYAAEHNGNQGDATDPFDGVRFTRFAWDENPAPRAHSGPVRGVPLAFALENIRFSGGQMHFAIERTARAGQVVGEVRWQGEVVLDGDIVVQPGARLVVADGARVLFARGDARGGGFDRDRGELLVYGELVFEGTATFASAAAIPGALDWSGIYLMNGQAIDESELRVRNARLGLVRFRLPPGRTIWQGDREIYGDLLVPADAELVVEPGALALFAGEDLDFNGISPSLSELVVEGRLLVRGEATRLARFTAEPGVDNDKIWYGVRVLPGSEVDVEYAQLDRAGFAFSGEVDGRSVFRVTDSVLRETAASGMSLTLNGEAAVDRVLFAGNTGPALRIDGSGLLRLRQARIERNGQEGILLNNASLEALDIQVVNNGLLDREDPRAGLRAVGGSGQKIEVWNSLIERNTLHGVDLREWLGQVELHNTSIRANFRDGLRAGRLEKLIFEQVEIGRNLGAGVWVDSALVELWTSDVLGNIGTALYLGPGSLGAIEMSHFGSGSGAVFDGVGELVVRTTSFERAPVGLELIDAVPILEKNRFVGNATGLKIQGPMLPSAVRDNVFIDNATALENASGQVLTAQGNYWGTVDSVAIAALVKGEVDFAKFLTSEPDLTAVVQERGGSVRFALYAGYPNPFNAEVVIPFALGAEARAELVVYDVLGRRVRVLVDEVLGSGQHRVVWNGRDSGGSRVASGVYFYRLAAEEFVAKGRVVLVR